MGLGATLTVTGADFGVPGVDDNAPDDVTTPVGPFTAGAGASFTCTDAGCN